MNQRKNLTSKETQDSSYTFLIFFFLFFSLRYMKLKPFFFFNPGFFFLVNYVSSPLIVLSDCIRRLYSSK